MVRQFENRIAEFFGSPYAIATDSCTHAIELCLRYKESDMIFVPKHTYLSIPMLSVKLMIPMFWEDNNWQDYYYLTDEIVDAAVLWKRNSYIPGTFMCISFQYQKHLSVGRLGVILCDNKEAALKLKMTAHDGREFGVPWRNQDINMIGYHYYAQPELCQIALNKLDVAILTSPKIWSYLDYPDLSQMKIFKK
jgi:dTDP-4-amino-4,6-dideoxygalactose transaminase